MIEHVFKNMGEGRSLYYSWFGALHTRVDLVLCHRSEEESGDLSSAIARELSHIEKMANRFDPVSELSRVNAEACRGPVVVGRELYALVRRALDWGGRVQGAFDPFVQSAGYHPDMRLCVECDDAARTLKFTRRGMCLDLNGIVKGYALDRCLELIRARGVTDALVNLGNSSIGALGSHPAGKGWPVEREGRAAGIPPLADVCLTTSGMNPENRFPLINPRTGEPEKRKLAVTVITDSGETGEVFSTALYVAAGEMRDAIRRLPECLSVYES